MTKRVEVRKECPMYGWMSNFSNHPISHGGKLYPTSEHFYQMAKVASPSTFPDKATKELAEEWREKIRNAPTPGSAKSLGKLIPAGVRTPNWDTLKFQIMKLALCLKLENNPELIALLLRLRGGDHYIVEVNYWHDTVWGICCCPKCNGQGENRLGNTWAIIRDGISNAIVPQNITV